MSLRLLRFSRAAFSSVGRLENLVLRLKLSLLMSWRHLLLKNSKEVNWPSGGVRIDFRVWSSRKYLCQSLCQKCYSSSLSWKKACNWTRRRNSSTSFALQRIRAVFCLFQFVFVWCTFPWWAFKVSAGSSTKFPDVSRHSGRCGTEINPILRTDFSESECGRFSGIVTTLLRISSH